MTEARPRPPWNPGAPRATLIIPTRDRPELLAETLSSVLSGTVVPTEIIVVDQSEASRGMALALRDRRRCEIRHLWVQSIGLSRARNRGVLEARCPIVVFTDDDILATPDWFGTLVRTLAEAGPRSVVTGRILPAVEREGGFVPAVRTSDRPAVYVGRRGVDPLAGGNMALFRSTFAEVGGFDERLGAGGRFRSAEDNDYGFRLLEAGYRIIYEPRAVLYHRAWRARSDLVPMRWGYGYGQGAFFAKHLRRRDPHMLGRMARRVAQLGLRAPRRALRQPLEARGDIAYIQGLVRGTADWLRGGRAAP